MEYNRGSYHNSGPETGKEFDKLAQKIATSIQKISQNVASMNKMVDQIATQQDSSDLRKKLHKIQHYTNQLARDTKTDLSQLLEIQPPPLSSDARQWKMQKDRLSDELIAALGSLQDTQRRAAQKETEEMEQSRLQLHQNQTLPRPPGRSSDYLIELESVASRNEPKPQQSTQLQIEDVNLHDLEVKEQHLLQLQDDIQGLNKVFADLAQVVHDQAELFDSIEAHVENASENVTQGGNEIFKAHGLKQKLRRKKVFLFVCAVVCVVILGVVIWFAV